MNKLFSLLTSIGVGAGLMYFYDPQRGNRRRAMVRDQVNRTINRADSAIDVAVTDLRNRTRGVLAETMGRLSDEGAPDWLLEERARATMGRAVSNSRAIEVTANGGRITLRGPVLASEMDHLLRRVAAVRGVHGVDSQLQPFEDPSSIPSLQGTRPEIDTRNWSPSMRLLSGVGGGLLALYGGMRRGLTGTAMSALGLGLVARGVTNLDFKRILGMGSARDAVTVQKAINIQAPVDELYRFWMNFENFPRFMQHLKEVKDLGNGRSHWKAAGPAGVDVEWDAIITRQVPNEVIAWQSVENSPLKNAGMVRFRSNPDGGSRITVQMSYTPPAGVVGHAVASFFGSDPKRAMDDDLGRLKTLFEAGETTVKSQKLTRQDLAGATS